MNNTLYFGDNLYILREAIADESVELIYLDPPFNSKRDYNLLFKTPKGHNSDAQITAFEDSWHWGEQAEREFQEILQQANTDAAEMIQSLRRFLHENDGIDITPLAIHLIERRMKEAFPALTFRVEGIPQDLDGARDLAERDKYHFRWWACSLVGAQPYQGKKKGADTGIDGVIYFQDDKGPAKKIIVSVKGGENVNRAMVADLKNSVEREKEKLGIFVTLTPPTKPMQTEAVSAGYYESPHSGAFEKIQILTIADLLNGKTVRYPDLSRGGTSFKKSRVEQAEGEQGELL